VWDEEKNEKLQEKKKKGHLISTKNAFNIAISYLKRLVGDFSRPGFLSSEDCLNKGALL